MPAGQIFLTALLSIARRRTSASAARPSTRVAAWSVAMACWRKGFYVRYGGDTIQLAPPFISEKRELERLIEALRDALTETS